MIRLARPDLTEDDIAAVVSVLRSGQLVQGEQVKAFEALIAERAGTTHAAAVSNGTAALHLALLAQGIGPGDRVAVPTFSWPATANAVVLCGAQPIFVDIESTTLGMDPERLQELLSNNARVDAILPVHAFGRMARIADLARIAAEHSVPLIEDAACALGAHLDGVAAGGWGVMGTFSFHPRKAATTGEGGAVACRDEVHVQRIRVLRNHGLNPNSPTPDFIDAGYNLRLTEFQAALGCSQLGRYDALIAARRRLAQNYDSLLSGLPISVPNALPQSSHVFQSYVILLDEAYASRRDALIAGLRTRGVESTIGTYHMPLLTYFRRTQHHKVGDHPVGESVAARAIALPLHPMLSEEDQRLVVAAIREELGC